MEPSKLSNADRRKIIGEAFKDALLIHHGFMVSSSMTKKRYLASVEKAIKEMTIEEMLTDHDQLVRKLGMRLKQEVEDAS